MKSLSNKQKQELIRLYLAGTGPTELARCFEVRRESIVGYLRRQGVQRTKAKGDALRIHQRQAREAKYGKVCTRCGEQKPTSSFYRRNNRHGYSSICKDCARIREREEYQRNPDRKIAACRRRDLKRFGLTEADYENLLVAQGGNCAICGVSPSKQKLCVDHCHETGRVRGLLCSPCNRAIGHLGDNPDGLRRALMYLEAFV